MDVGTEMTLSPDVAALNPHVKTKTLKVKRDVIPSVPGLKSELEASLYRQIENEGLPIPILQVTLAKALGRAWEYDGAWIEERIAYEVNGATYVKGGHSTGNGIHRDYEKANAAVLLGWRLFVFDRKMIDDGQALETLKKAFEWLGTDKLGW
jgi:hypothetical protein